MSGRTFAIADKAVFDRTLIDKDYCFFTPKQYAKFTHYTPRTIYRHLKAGYIKGAFKQDGHWRIPMPTPRNSQQ